MTRKRRGARMSARSGCCPAASRRKKCRRRAAAQFMQAPRHCSKRSTRYWTGTVPSGRRKPERDRANNVVTEKGRPRERTAFALRQSSRSRPDSSVRRLSAYLFFMLPDHAYCEKEVMDSQAGGNGRGDKSQIGLDVAEEGVPAISDHETRDLEQAGYGP